MVLLRRRTESISKERDEQKERHQTGVEPVTEGKYNRAGVTRGTLPAWLSRLPADEPPVLPQWLSQQGRYRIDRLVCRRQPHHPSPYRSE
jgi:hypothetical protein